MSRTDISGIKTPVYKLYRMEDFLDIHFYHPVGLFFAKVSYRLSLSPNAVSVISMLVGIAGGVLLFRDESALAGWVLIVFSGVLDSSDGQLARMTGSSSLSGRILDGLIGYVSFTFAYAAMAWNGYAKTGDPLVFVYMLAAGVFSAMHSSMYDFYRTTFARVTAKGMFLPDEKKDELGGFFSAVYSLYGFYQNLLASKHRDLLKRAEEKARTPERRERISRLYDEVNFKTVHLWNALGDNAKIIGILLAILAGYAHYYFYFVIFAMNAVFACALLKQREADYSFMRGLEAISEDK